MPRTAALVIAFWYDVPGLPEPVTGYGYCFSPSALVKASFRKDAHWGVDPSVRPFVPDGYALAGQLSIGFDAAERLRRC